MTLAPISGLIRAEWQEVARATLEAGLVAAGISVAILGKTILLAAALSGEEAAAAANHKLTTQP